MLTKREIDIQLLHSCIEEKWKPFANGLRYHYDFDMYNQNSAESCVLCQMYMEPFCSDCPLKQYTRARGCNFPGHKKWVDCIGVEVKEQEAAKEVLAVLEAALKNLKEGEEQ